VDQSTTSTLSTISSKTVSASSTNNPSISTANHTGLSVGAKVGIGVGAAVIFLSILGALFMIVRRKRRTGLEHPSRQQSQHRFEKPELDTQELPRTHGRAELVGSPFKSTTQNIAEVEVNDSSVQKENRTTLSELEASKSKHLPGRGREAVLL
jgi:hypothetical protein